MFLGTLFCLIQPLLSTGAGSLKRGREQEVGGLPQTGLPQKRFRFDTNAGEQLSSDMEVNPFINSMSDLTIKEGKEEEMDDQLMDFDFDGHSKQEISPSQEDVVPKIVNKILLPSWKENIFSDDPDIVLRTRETFSDDMAAYLDTLLFAHLVEAGQPMGEVFHEKSQRLANMMKSFFAVDINSLPAAAVGFNVNLKSAILRNVQRIPSILMVGHQWGFDVVRMARNLLIMDVLSGDMRALLQSISAQWAPLPDLYPSTVAKVCWAMNPVFVIQYDSFDTPHFIPDFPEFEA
jgi:hypothetical protein